MSQMFKLAICIACVSVIVGCSKPNIVHIIPPEEATKLTIEGIINNKDITAEQKAQMIQLKMSETMEHKKKAVETERDGKLSAIINRPVTPLRTPDTILRVLVLPYEDNKGILNSWRYSFIKVDDGRWVLSDYLNGTKPSGKQTLTPLK